MEHELKGKNVPIKLWAPVHEIESGALDQLKNVAALPWAFHHVALMPDGHVGKGATVGSVVALKDAISPAAVGVDIGCGMAAVQTNLKASDLPNSLKALRDEIEAVVPVGFMARDKSVFRPLYKTLFDKFSDLDRTVHSLRGKAELQMGTLGGGNHFIEVCLDLDQNVWIMLHSGSRNVGKELAGYHIDRAKKLAHNQDLPDRDLSVFLAGTPEMKAYVHDLNWAQDYARLNREVMLNCIYEVFNRNFPQVVYSTPIYCHHNYVGYEKHFDEMVYVTRKGAINAEKGKLGIIPGSMGTKSYIVEGLGNPESFNSASHGAGRRMSRTKAKATFTIADLEEQTKGVECRKDQGVVDEIPGSYKDLDEVMNNQKDLVKIITELKQVICIKG